MFLHLLYFNNTFILILYINLINILESNHILQDQNLLFKFDKIVKNSLIHTIIESH